MMQLPNLQAKKAASSTAAPTNQQSIRPQSEGLMKASMKKTLLPDSGNKVAPTSQQNMMRTTMATPPTQSDSVQPSRYTPETMDVTGDMRVEDRVMGLMSSENPLMKKARERANQYSASRGLQSSSIANENALNAMFDAALPIAQQDANTYSTVAQTNNQNNHQVGMQDNAALNQLMLNKDGQQFTAGESAKDRAHQETLQSNQFDFESGQSGADRALQRELQESSQQFQSGENQANRDFQKELEELSYQNSLGLLDAEGQQRMRELESQQNFQSGENEADRSFQEQMQQKQQEFQSGENQADREFQQELEGLRYQNSLGLLDAEGQQRMAELEQQYQNNRGLMEMEQSFTASENQANREFQMQLEKYKTAAQLEVNMALQNDMQAFNKELEQMRNANQMGMLDREGELRMAELEQQNANAMKQMDRSAAIQTQRDNLLQQFQGDNMQLEMANRLTEIEAQAKAQMEMQASQNGFAQKMEYSNAVSNAVNQGISSLGEAFMNPEIDPSQYGAIQAQINKMVQDNITNYADIYGVGGEGEGSDQSGETAPPPPPYSEYRGNEDSAGGQQQVAAITSPRLPGRPNTRMDYR